MENIRGIEELKQQYPLYYLKWKGEIFSKEWKASIQEKSKTILNNDKLCKLMTNQDKEPKEA